MKEKISKTINPESVVANNNLIAIAPYIIIGLVMYFMVSRNQKKYRKEKQELIDNLKVGNKIITSGGIHGVINKYDTTDESIVFIKINTDNNPDIIIKIEKSSVNKVIPCQ